jgi:group I intron endonuclease
LINSIENVENYTIGIYRITNKILNKHYIGKSVNVKSRLKQHYRELSQGNHCNYLLQRDFDKYKEISFEVALLKECEEKDLNKFESHFCHENDVWRKGYNIAKLRNVTNVKTKEIQKREALVGTLKEYDRLITLVNKEGELKISLWEFAQKIGYDEDELKLTINLLKEEDLKRLPFVIIVEKSFSINLLFRSREKDKEIQGNLLEYV